MLMWRDTVLDCLPKYILNGEVKMNAKMLYCFIQEFYTYKADNHFKYIFL